MNKKFTMMLAAFLAAGYTITAEAGVVKVSQPVSGKTYIIGNGDKFLKLGTNAAALPVTATFKDATDFTITLKDNGVVNIKKGSNGITYNTSTGFITYNSEFDRISLEGISGTNTYYLKGTETADTKYLKIGESTTEAVASKDKTKSPLTFFVKSTTLMKAENAQAYSISDYYFVINEKEEVVFVDFATYSRLYKPTVWNTTSDGKVMLVQNAKADKYLSFDGESFALTEDANKAAIFEQSNGKLVVSTIEAPVAKFVTISNGTLRFSDVEPENAIATSQVVTTPANEIFPSDDVEINQVADAKPSFTGKSRLAYYNADGSLAGYLMMNKDNLKLQTVSEGEATGELATWVYNADKMIITNSNGVNLAADSEVAFEIVYLNKYRAFYLRSKNKSTYAKVDGNELVLTTADQATIFSATEAYQESMAAGDVNAVNRGVAFSLVYKFSDDKPATYNPFNTNMKAFYVDDEELFYLATEWPEKYNGVTENCKISYDELTSGDFVFMVATPNEEDWNIQKFNGLGEGVKFKPVNGKI